MNCLTIYFFTSFIHRQGTYFRFHNLAIGLTKLGHRVTVFGCDNNRSSKTREETRDGVKYHILPIFKGTTFFGAGSHPLTAMRRCLLNYPPCDIAHLFQPFLNAALPWRISLKNKSKLLFYDWDDLWDGGILQGRKIALKDYWVRFSGGWLEKRLPAMANHVTTCSCFLSRQALRRGAKGITMIYNGFWPNNNIQDKKVAREKLGLDSNAIYVGFMGATVGELSWCFEALKMNLSRHENLRLALCGFDARILNGLSSELLQRIDFLGYLPYSKIQDFASAIDLGLLPLENNSFNQSRFPIKYAEYMTAGTPVLCSDVGECAYLSGGFPWVIMAGRDKNQWLKSFKYAIELAIIGRLPKVNRDILAKILSWEVISKKLLEIYLLQLQETTR